MSVQRLRPHARGARRLWRRALAAGAAALLFGSLAGCGEQHTSLPRPEHTTLHIGTQALIDDAPLFIAQAKRLFAQHGLQVRFEPQPNDAAAIDALKSGKIDLAFASDVSLFKSAAAGTKLRVQAEAYQAGNTTMAVVVPQQLQYGDPSRLGTVTVAVNEPHGLGTLVSSSTLATLGIDADHIHYVTMPFKDMADAVASGRVTGAWMEEPYLTEAERGIGAFALATDTGGQMDLPLSSYASTKEFAEKNPNTMRIFRSVLSQAARIATDRREVQKVLPQYTGVDPNAAALVSIGTFPTTLSAVRLQRVADRMQSAGILHTRLDVQRLIPPDAKS